MADLSTKQLSEALRLRKVIDQLEAQLESTHAKLQSVLAGGPARKPKGRKKQKTSTSRRGKRGPRKGSQKTLVHEVLNEASTPLTMDQILERLKAKGYTSKAKDAKKTLGVMLYTDKAVKRAGRGLFRIGKSAAPKAKSKRGTRKKVKSAAKKK